MSRSDLAAAFAARQLDWIVPAWEGSPRVHAFFTTRTGGVSTGPQASLDLGPALPAPGPQFAAVTENRQRLRTFLPAEPVWMQQVHGVDVIEIAVPPKSPPIADAAVTRADDMVLAVRTADCLPVLLADRAGTVLALAHAGWRGLAAGVLERALAAMQVDARDIAAWIGPSIGPGAFEVGQDVWTAFCDRDPASVRHFTPLRDGKWMADLPGLATARLMQAGARSVTGGTWCTHRDAARFFSYRRDPRAGRMALVAWLAA